MMNTAGYALMTSIVVGVAAGAMAVQSAKWRRDGDREGEARIEIGDIVRAALVGTVGFLVAFAAGVLAVGLDMYGRMNLVFLGAVVGVPIASSTVLLFGLLRRRRRHRGLDEAVPEAGRRRVEEAGTRAARARAFTRPALIALAVGLLFAPLGYYMVCVEPYWLSVDEVGPITVAAERSGSETIRVGVLTDFQLRHIGAYEVGVIDQLLAARPDVILLPGDVFQGESEAFQRELPAIRAQFARLQVPGGAYLVDGDTDPVERMRKMAEGTPVQFLDNEIIQTKVRDRTVTIGGVGLNYQSSAARRVVTQLETQPGQDDIRILLAHRPDAVDNLPTGHPRTDLVVSGHTHGGQVSIPGYGPLMTLSGVPRSVAAGGLHDMDGRRIYVGRGAGLERGQAPAIRFLVRPNIGTLIIGG